MENVEQRSAQLREKIPLREDPEGVYCIIDSRNQKVILAIQFYEPEPDEELKPHYAFCEDLGAASTLLSQDDLNDQFRTLQDAYELGAVRIDTFAKHINGGL